MKKNANQKNSSFGFSLIELVVAIGMLSIVATATGYLMINSKMRGNRVLAVADLDRTHINSLHIARNSNLIKNSLNLTDPLVASCFSYKASTMGSCASLNMDQFYPISGGYDLGCSSCNVSSTISYRRVCTAKNCTKVEVMVRTTPGYASYGGGGEETSQIHSTDFRESSFMIPGVVYAEKNKIDFSCALGGNLVTSVDYSNGKAICSATISPPNSSCTGHYPMKNFESTDTCQTATPTPCAVYGYSSTQGMINSNCRGTGT